MFGWSLILRCYEIFPNNNIFFHLKKVLSLCPLTSLSCTLKLPVTVWQAIFGFASRNESNYSMGFGLMANTFCYYLRNIEHVPLISGSFKKSNRKTEPNLPKYLYAAVPRDVLKSSPQLPLRSRVPVPEHVGLLLGSAGMLGPEAKCDSAQGKSLPLGSRLVLGGGGSHREFSFKRSQILILKRVSCAKGELHSLKKWLFPSWPLPPRCFSTGFGLVCFTRKKHSQQEQCVFPLGWWVELVQGSTERRSRLRNVPFWPHWTSKSIWCLWGWSCVGPMLQWSNFTSAEVFCWVFVPQVSSEDQPYHPNSCGWHISTFLGLKQWRYGWFNRDNCKSSLIEGFQEAAVTGGWRKQTSADK